MNKPSTELPVPAKERLIIRMHFTTVLEPDVCELCHMRRVPGPGEKTVPLMCDVCGRMLCNACYGNDGTLTGSDLKQYHICDVCADDYTGLRGVEIDAILEMRAKLGGMR